MKEAIFHPEARAEMRESIDFYEVRLEGLGLRFLAAVEETTKRIVAYPDGHKYFDSISDESGKHIAVDLVDKQLADLEAAAGAIEHYVDRRIAHYDKRDLATPVPSFKDLEDALRALETLVIFYWTVLKESGLVGLTPTIQYDWQDVFEFAWIERREADDAGPNDQLERDLRSAL